MEESLWISRKTYEQMVWCDCLYETGGFIGITDNKIVKYKYDEGEYHEMGCYFPSKKQWEKFLLDIADECDYFGILHSHLNGHASLSAEDVGFIEKLFFCNSSIEKMYFPIVIPLSDLVIYAATRTIEEGILIKKCKLIIINEEELL